MHPHPLPRRPLAGIVLGLALMLPHPVGHAAVGDPAPVPVGAWPLRPEPVVAQRFEEPPHPYAPGHRGVDLRARAGQSVHAAMAGTVTFASPLAGRGVVVVDHGPTRTTYEPVAATVAPGERVGAGAVLGRVEQRGSHCPPVACLHWGWREGEVYLDPLLLVGEAGVVRLLPLDGGPSTPRSLSLPRPLGVGVPW